MKHTTSLEPPKNQWALCIRLLIENHKQGMTMREAVNEHFYKYQTRLLEIEVDRRDKLKIRRLRVPVKTRFGTVTTVINYKSLAPLPYLMNLYHKLNREGLPKSVKDAN